MHPSNPVLRHRVGISGEIDQGRVGADAALRAAPLPFRAEAALSADEVGVALLSPGTTHDRFEFDGIGTLQADGVLSVTLTIRFLADDTDWPEGPDAADAWSTVVSVDAAEPFVLHIEGDGE